VTRERFGAFEQIVGEMRDRLRDSVGSEDSGERCDVSGGRRGAACAVRASFGFSPRTGPGTLRAA